MPAQVLKNNFTSGELTPKLHRRPDIQQYQNGVETGLNVHVSQYGGLRDRFGTRYIVNSKDSGKLSILHPFEFNVTQAYVIQFGENYIRFYKDGAQIVVAYSAWAELIAYTVGELVAYGGSYYRCIVAHTSGVFIANLASGFWEEMEGVVNFYGLEQSSRNWEGVTAASNDNIYACVYNGDIYMQTAGTGDFVALSQTSRGWQGLAAASSGNVYCCVYGGDIYMQTAGAGDFVALSQTSRSWRDMAAAPNGNVYACVFGGDIYMQTAGAGDFVALSQTSRNWSDMSTNAGGDVYACVLNGDIYMQTSGAGDFVALSQTSRNWSGMAAAPNGNVYASEYGGDIYMQTAGSGDFVALSQTNRNWFGMAASPSGRVYAAVFGGDIYVPPDSGSDVAYEIPSTYTEDELRSLRFEPSSDALYIFHENHYPAKLTRTAHTSWTLADQDITGGPFEDDNTTATTLTPSATANLLSEEFEALGQTSRDWRGMAATPSGNIYTCAVGGDIYMQTAGAGGFNALSQTSRTWGDIETAPNGNVYVSVFNGDIYMQTAGAGDFVALSQTSRDWYSMAAAPNGNVYAADYGGDIYMQTAGAGDFVALSQTSRNWNGMAAAPNGNVYAAVSGGDIYMQTAGAGAFVALSQTSRVWVDMGANAGGDVYACVLNGGIYKQTAGAGNFVDLGQTNRNWQGIAAAPNGNVYASVYNGGDIYMTPTGVFYPKITASTAIFESGHVDSLWKLSSGAAIYEVASDISSNTQTAVVETASESVEIEISGTWNADVIIERSFNKGTDFYKYMNLDANCVKQLTDSRDIQYRVAVENYVSGTVSVRLSVLDSDSDGQGTFKIISVAEDGLSCYADIIEPLRSTDATTIWAEAAWSGVNGYPRVGKINEGRLVMWSTDENPHGVWGSSSLEYDNMLAGADDDDAFKFTMDAVGGVNIARWMLSWKNLTMGSAGGETRLLSSGMTPSNPPDKKQDSGYGSANIQAFVAGKSIIFVDRCERILREYAYDYNSEVYDSKSVSTISEHILNNGGGIVDIAYQQKQNSIIWCVLDDGTLATVTYMPDQQVLGWTPHTLGGTAEAEAVCVVPGSNGHDEVWLTVKRTIDGSVVRYVEKIEEDDTEFDGTNAVWRVDCGAVYSGTAATVITGLDYLEGGTVAVLADSVSVGPKTVSSGSITLDIAAEYVIVGLPFTSRIKTLKPDPGAADGTVLGRKLKVTNPVLHFINTGKGIQFGPDLTRLSDIPDLTAGALTTADIDVTMPGGYDTDGQIIIQNSEPVPMYLASLTYDVSAGD